MPKFKKYNSPYYANINPSRYRVKWDGDTRSKFQTQVKRWMRPYWQYDVCLEEMPVVGTRLRCDLVNLTRKIIIETSGKQHNEYNKHFHQKSRQKFHEQIRRDEVKREWAKQNSFTFIEIFVEDMPLTEKFFFEKYGIEL
jgi:hypothetical protein